MSPSSPKSMRHPIYALLRNKASLQNNADLVTILGSRSASEVLMQLAYLQEVAYKHKRGWFFRPIKQLIADLGLSDSTIRRAISLLEQLGLVEKKRKRLARNKSRSVNFYRVNMDCLRQLCVSYYGVSVAESGVEHPHPEIDEVFGGQTNWTPTDQSVIMTDSILETILSATPPPRFGTNSGPRPISSWDKRREKIVHTDLQERTESRDGIRYANLETYYESLWDDPD